MANTTAQGKVEALIARALSTHSEEEARTSALIAVRLIKEHGLLTGSVRVETRTEYVKIVDPAAYDRGHMAGYSEGLRDARRAHADAAREEGYRREVKPEPEVTNVRAHTRKVSGARSFRRTISAKFAGHCSYCDSSFQAGDSISWRKGGRSFHARCYTDMKRQGATAA